MRPLAFRRAADFQSIPRDRFHFLAKGSGEIGYRHWGWLWGFAAEDIDAHPAQNKLAAIDLLANQPRILS